MKTMIALGIAALVATPAAAVTSIVFTADFDSAPVQLVAGDFASATRTLSAGGATRTPAAGLPGFGSHYLRNTGTGTTSFAVTGLGAHNMLRLQFDLAFLDSWDGSEPGRWGPDFLFMTIGGQEYVLTSNNAQGVADYGPGVEVARGMFAHNAQWKDVVVRYDLWIPHVADSFGFSFRAGGAGFQGGNDESWGIDNIRLSAGIVPEPATWAMLIAGFGLVGASLRRRRGPATVCA